MPSGLACEHCVLQWYWVAANSCNPPGVVEFFEGPRGPTSWGRCPGQGGALGGYTSVQKDCGGSRFPEEYYQCADIRIGSSGSSDADDTGDKDEPHGREEKEPKDSNDDNDGDQDQDDSRKEETGSTTPPPAPPADEYDPSRRGGYGAVRDIILVSEGRRVTSLYSSSRIDLGEVRDMSVEAYVASGVDEVDFIVSDSRGRTLLESRQKGGGPFYIRGTDSNGRPTPWDDVPTGEIISILVLAQLDGKRDRDIVRILFLS